MIILVNATNPKIAEFRSPHLGRLLQPDMFSALRVTLNHGMVWAADNGCYHRWDERKYREMLRSISRFEGCKFVTTPDVVGDAVRTLEMFEEWEPIIRNEFGLPVALVGQDGAEAMELPWERMDALFLGGSTEWKLNRVEGLVGEAKRRGKWVHMGRVNTPGRLRYAQRIGCDSVDGSGLGRFPREMLPPMLRELAQMKLWDVEEVSF